MLPEQLCGEVREWDGASASLGLGEWCGHQRAVDLGHDSAHVDEASAEVDRVYAESEALSPAQTRPAGDGDECPISLGDGRK